MRNNAQSLNVLYTKEKTPKKYAHGEKSQYCGKILQEEISLSFFFLNKARPLEKGNNTSRTSSAHTTSTTAGNNAIQIEEIVSADLCITVQNVASTYHISNGGAIIII